MKGNYPFVYQSLNEWTRLTGLKHVNKALARFSANVSHYVEEAAHPSPLPRLALIRVHGLPRQGMEHNYHEAVSQGVVSALCLN